MGDGGLVVGTIIKPKLGLQPKPFGEACYAFWQGGDFIKNDEPQGNHIFCQMNECIPEVVKAMRACIKETGESKLFSANITADDPAEMIARGKYVLSQFGPLGENTAFLVDGYVSGGTAITVARRNFPAQFLHYHRLATKMVRNRVPCRVDRAKKHGNCGRQARTGTSRCRMVSWSMPRPMKRSKEHSLPSRKMLTKFILGGRKNWVIQVNPLSKRQLLTGRRRQLHDRTF